MHPVNEALAAAEPWSTIAALVLGLVVPYLLGRLKARFPNLPIPTMPAAPLPTAPGASAGPQFGPVVSGLVEAIRRRIKVVNPDADPDEAISKVLYRELTYGQECNPPPPAKDSAQLAG